LPKGDRVDDSPFKHNKFAYSAGMRGFRSWRLTSQAAATSPNVSRPGSRRLAGDCPCTSNVFTPSSLSCASSRVSNVARNSRPFSSQTAWYRLAVCRWRGAWLCGYGCALLSSSCLGSFVWSALRGGLDRCAVGRPVSTSANRPDRRTRCPRQCKKLITHPRHNEHVVVQHFSYRRARLRCSVTVW
jgi:hypothetical protein